MEYGNTTLGINKKIVRFFHKVMLVGMMHSTIAAPSQTMLTYYFTKNKPLKYKGADIPSPSVVQNQSNEPAQAELTSLVTNKPNVIQNVNEVGEINNNLLSYSIAADINYGVIGTSKENPLDDARDNLFKFDIDEMPDASFKAYLTYEVYGVTSSTGVSTSINDRYATGGYLIKQQEGWSIQKEEVNVAWLHAGKNKVMFSVPKNAGYSYKVKNIKVEFKKETTGTLLPALVVNNTDISFAKNNQVYVKGFVRNNAKEVKVYAENIELTVTDGAFEGFITLNDEIKLRQFIVIKAADANGFLGQEMVSLNNLIEADRLLPIDGIENRASSFFNANTAGELATDGAMLMISDEALSVNSLLSISKLRNVDIAPLNSGMINVTKGGVAYRFLPDGTKFNAPVKIELEYEEKLLPPGYTSKDVKTFYFDTSSKSWIAVQRDTINVKLNTISSYTNHFTDYINGVIQTPESPETAGFTPTMMNDVKAADPSAEMTIIGPPEVSQKGDANVSYPIKIPAGRNGMQPQLTIQYSNEGTNGWVGQGWSVNIPAISIDTRWGTPLLDPTKESEIYMLNGEQLMYPNLDGENWMPNRHYDVSGTPSTVYSTQSRTRISNAVFTPRKQGSFSKIERLGNSISTYYWRVTTTDGTIHWYGGDKDGIKENTIIRNASTNAILHWGLYMTEDVHKNNVIYEYRNDTIPTQSGLDANLNGGRIFNIDKIYYTGHSGKKGPYLVRFETKTPRADVSINARLGIKQIEPYFLDYIKVGKANAPTTHIRSYLLKMGYGKFKKGRLLSVAELNRDNIEFYKHTFEYYDDLAVDGADVYFANWQTQTICNDAPVPTCPDNDNDGVCNAQDNCIDQPGSASNNGCPEICKQAAFFAPSEKVYFYHSPNAGLGWTFHQYNCYVSSCQLIGYVMNGLPVSAIPYNIFVIHGAGNDPTVSRCPYPNAPATTTPNTIIKNPDGEGRFLNFQSDFFSTYNLQTFNPTHNYNGYYQLVHPNDPSQVYVLNESKLQPSFYSTADMDLKISFRWGKLNGSNIDWSTITDTFLKTQTSFNVTSAVYVNNSTTPLGFYPLYDPAGAIMLQANLASAYPGTVVNSTPGTGNIPTLVNITTSNPNLQSVKIVLSIMGNTYQTNTYNFSPCNSSRPADLAGQFEPDKVPDEIIQQGIYQLQADGKELDYPIKTTNVISFAKEGSDEEHDGPYIIAEEEGKYTWQTIERETITDAVLIEKLNNQYGIGKTGNSAYFEHHKADEIARRKVNQEKAIIWLQQHHKKSPVAKTETVPAVAEKTVMTTNNTPSSSGSNLFQQLQNNFSIGFTSSVTGNPDCPTFSNSVFMIPGSIPSFNSAGAILGSTASKNVNLGGHLGFGVDFSWDPTTKNITVGGGYSHSWDESESLTALVDINGDGLDDMVFKHFGSLFWKRHIVTRTYDSNNQPIITHSFGSYSPILSVNNETRDFYKSNGDSSSWNLQVNFGFSGGGAFAGYESSKNNSKSTIYFTDANADGLIDIVKNGVVYFNRISSGNPYFEPQSLDTENMLIVAAPVTVTPPPVEVDTTTPNYDVVKVWEAPADGAIKIENSIVNIDPTKEAVVTIEMEKQDAENTCGGTVNPSGGMGTFTYDIYLGTETGQVCVDYDSYSVPDKFTILWNGQTYSSGYVGSSNDNAALINAGVNPAEINTANPSNGNGILCFNKTSAEPSTMQVIVTGPLGSTGWTFSTNCPGQMSRSVKANPQAGPETKQSFNLSFALPANSDEGPIGIYIDNFPLNIKKPVYTLYNSATKGDNDLQQFISDFEKVYPTSKVSVSQGIVTIKITDSYLHFNTLELRSINGSEIKAYAFTREGSSNESFTAIPENTAKINTTTCTYTPAQMCLLFGVKLNSGTPSVSNIITNVNSQCNPSGGLLRVKKGERIYFRIHSVANGNPAINWDPKISYTNSTMQATTDQNSLPVYSSSYSDGFILSKNAPVTFPGSGTAQILWDNLSVVNPTDEVTFQIIKRTVTNGSFTDTAIFTKVCPPNVTTSVVPVGVNSISVSTSSSTQVTQFIFRVKAASNVNWKAIEWKPSMVCTTIQPVVATQNGPSEGNLSVAETKYPIVDYSIYSSYLCSTPYRTVAVSGTSQNIMPSLSGSLFASTDNGVLYFVVKRGNAFLGRKTITVTNGNPVISPAGVIPLTGTGPLEIGFYTDDSARAINSPTDVSLLRRLINAATVANFTGTATTAVSWSQVNLYHKQIGLFGSMYRQWGQFMYNAGAAPGATPITSLGVNLIKEELLTITNAQATALHDALLNSNHNVNSNVTALQNIDINSPGGPAAMQAALQNISNSAGINSMPFLIANPSRDQENGSYIDRWIGFHNECYSNASGARAATLSQSFSFQEDSTTSQGALNTGAYGIDKHTKGSGESVSGGGSFGGFGASGTSSLGGVSNALTDYIDLNGDRYPDIVTTGQIQYTLKTGGLFAPVNRNSFGGEMSIDKNGSWGFSASGTFGKSGKPNPGAEGAKIPANGKLKIGKPGTSSYGGGNNSTSISGNFGQGDNSTSRTWADINGDGLPDIISRSGSTINVHLNLGNPSFNANNYWGSFQIGTGKSTTFGAGVGFNYANASIEAGVSLGRTDSDTENTLIDINGDGLLDKVSSTNSSLAIDFNRGNKFIGSPITINSFSLYNNATTTNMGLNGTATYSMIWPLYLIFVVIPLKIPDVSVTAAGGTSTNRTKKSIVDFDGDGYPDIVEEINSSTVKISHSRIRRTDMLKTVNNPLGGKFTIDYEVQPVDYNNPQPKWTMKSLVMEDGYDKVNDGEDIYRKEFTYEKGRYDRREREFYGYATVKTTDYAYDFNGDQGAAYRTLISAYHNNSYFLNGLLKETYTIKGNDPNSKFQKTINTYEIKKLNSTNTELLPGSVLPDNFDVGGREGRRTAAVVLTKTVNELYELSPSPQLITQTNMKYDGKGRVVEFTDLGNIADPNDNYITQISYHNLANNIISVPSELRVLINSSEVRKRTTDVNPTTGKISAIKAYLDSGDYAKTMFDYDIYGNISYIEFPQNDNGQSMFYKYTYDTTYYKYIIGIQDAFGYTSSADYDSDYDKILKTNDLAGNEMRYMYDGFGRTFLILAPKEAEAGKRYTIMFSYYPKFSDIIPGSGVTAQNFVPVAITQNFDMQHPDNDIETITFIDGLGRPIQVKKDITLNKSENHQSPDYYEAMSVSGKVSYDQYARTAQQFHPYFEAKSPTTKLILNEYASPDSSLTSYDEIDRAVSVIDPANNSSTTEYSIDQDVNGVMAVKTRSVTDQNGSQSIVTETYKDVFTRVISSMNEGPNGPIWTKYKYNALGELLEYTDDQPLSTIYKYDNFGRKIYVEHPDNGKTTYKYDMASNLLELQTNNLAVDGTVIKYEYYFNRLVHIQFPQNPDGSDNISNVDYKYGNTGNETGRIVFQKDATGTQNFEYGNMGELIYNRRTVVGPTPSMPVRIFETKYTYDSWNRMILMIYPDGEKVSFGYDLGGNLNKMSGNVNNAPYNYIERIDYDHYEERAYLLYGNKTETFYNYTPELRRLDNLNVKTSDGQDLFNNNYSYDNVGNVKRIDNIAGVTANYMGGTYKHKFEYDNLNRLRNAEGQFDGNSIQQELNNDFYSDYKLSMQYNSTHGIVQKGQYHYKNNATYLPNTYENAYEYYDGTHRVKTVTDASTGNNEFFKYDENGNLTLKGDNQGNNRNMYWDESNRLRVVDDNNKALQHYIYDASGERVLKANSDVQQTFQNGTLLDPSSVTINNYTTYPSAFLVIDGYGVYSKHYFAGSQRIVSRIGDQSSDIFNDSGRSGQGEMDVKQLQQQQVKDLNLILEKAKLGKAKFREYKPYTYEDIKKSIEEELKADTENNSIPPPPPADPGPLYFYHPDHLGTSTFLTDINGMAYQFFMNLPFGETMAEQLPTGYYKTPYKFNGKELDEETGLYYYGARYYDPKVSIWYSTDPMAEKYPAYSPYNYCFNNPVVYIDPDGMDPTPYPKSGIGSPNYYIFRYLDFVKQNPGKKAPDYYLNYGNKYIQRFTKETNNQLSKEGKKWLVQARKNLQVAIENRLALPDGKEFEQNNKAFHKFAFDSHVDAYWDAGLNKLNTVDLVAIVLTPNFKDLTSEDGMKQAKEMMGKLADYWIDNPVEGLKRGTELLLNQKKIKAMVLAKAIREGVDPDKAWPIVEKILERIPTIEP